MQQATREAEAARGEDIKTMMSALSNLDSVSGAAQAELDALRSEVAAMTLLRSALLGGTSAPSVEELVQAQ